MLYPNQIVKTTWNSTNMEYYIAKGYKVFRIVSSRTLPSKEQIEENINVLLNMDKDIIYLELK